MKTQADKSQENKSRSVANVISQNQGIGGSGFQFVDNRPEATAQRKLQAIANRGSRSKSITQLVVQRTHPSFQVGSYANATGTTLGPNAQGIAAQGWGHSDILRASLTGSILAGEGDVPDSNLQDQVSNQAHHIVEVNDGNAAHSRDILDAAGIDIDSAINGVLLPAEASDDGGDAAIHLGSHRAEYALAVNASLDHAILNNAPGGGWPGAGGGIPNILALVPANPAAQGHLRAVLVARIAEIRELLLEDGAELNARGDGEWGQDLIDLFGNRGII